MMTLAERRERKPAQKPWLAGRDQPEAKGRQEAALAVELYAATRASRGHPVPGNHRGDYWGTGSGPGPIT